MTRILLVGYDPETVDFSDPALPPGMTAEKIRAGILVALKRFAERGWEADVGYIRPDETAGPTVERQLASVSYDCVVIGAGVRLPPQRLALFEAVINAVHRTAPGAAIAFNTRPEDSADAAARWLPAEGKARSSSCAQTQIDPVRPEHIIYCSFCGKSQHQVRKVIAVTQVFICDECVRLCADILDDEEARKHLQPPRVN